MFNGRHMGPIPGNALMHRNSRFGGMGSFGSRQHRMAAPPYQHRNNSGEFNQIALQRDWRDRRYRNQFSRHGLEHAYGGDPYGVCDPESDYDDEDPMGRRRGYGRGLGRFGRHGFTPKHRSPNFPRRRHGYDQDPYETDTEGIYGLDSLGSALPRRRLGFGSRRYTDPLTRPHFMGMYGRGYDDDEDSDFLDDMYELRRRREPTSIFSNAFRTGDIDDSEDDLDNDSLFEIDNPRRRRGRFAGLGLGLGRPLGRRFPTFSDY